MNLSHLVLLQIALLLPLIAPATSPREQESRQLVAIVQSDAPLQERARACQQLTIFGTEEAVPVLAAMLANEALSHYAREALEAMPYPAAGSALRDTLHTLEGNLLIGVVNSLGMRREADAIEALGQLVSDPASGAASVALLALGRIAGPKATHILQQTLTRGPEELRAAAAEGCVLVADRHLAHGQRDAAVALYDAVRFAQVPVQLRVTATRGAIVAGGSSGFALLIEQLRSGETAMRDVALLSLRNLPAPEVTSAIIAELYQARPSLQLLLVVALADRDDSRVVGVIEAMAKADSEEVRIAALKALGRVGRSSSLPVLLQAVRAPSCAEANAALASLARILAPDTNAEIVMALPSFGLPWRAKLIGVLGERNAHDAMAELLDSATEPDLEIAKASLRSLALVARPADLPGLIRLALATQDEELKTLAARALATTAMKEPHVERRAEAVLAALRQATDANAKVLLLRPLGVIIRSMGGSHEAFLTVRSALDDRSPAVREAALRCLAGWPNAAPSKSLLEFACRSGVPSAQREVALRSAIRMASNVAAGRDDSSPLDALVFFADASRIVRTKEEKLMLVWGLGSLKQIEAVQMLLPYLDDLDVQTEAALAVVQIAPALLGSEHGDWVKRVLESIATTEIDEDTRRKAARTARELPSTGVK